MEKISSLYRSLKLPSKREINLVFTSFSKGEWAIFSALALVLLFSTIFILQTLNKSFMVSVPAKGGSISEGIVGTPRFINPVLAFSDVDVDMTALIYSGLMRKSFDNTLIPDLAEKYEASEDGLMYTFTLKDNIYFHDGEPVTADDVVFTITKAKEPLTGSPRNSNWSNVSVEKIDDKTVSFSLRQPHASFLKNTTIGILPMHIWSDSPIELNDANTNPIGSGPYMVTKVNKGASGIINSYELTRFKKFSLGEPYIKEMTFKFYPNENALISALEDGEIEQLSSISPSSAERLKEDGYRIESAVLPRIFGLFFNQNQNQLFTNKSVVTAIDQAVDKDRIVREVLYGYGIAIDNPIPPNMIAYQRLGTEKEISREDQLAKAEEVLAKDGWKKNEEGFLEKVVTEKGKKTTTLLEFSISTGNAPELAQAAELVKENLQAIGMKVDVKTFEVGNLNQSVIRPREYDVLLFGQIINQESDLYAFWHSSQRKDPGLNVAMYTNAKVDKILEDAFITVDESERIKKYSQFEDEIKKDMPAVFLYSPNFIYLVSKNLQGINIDHITSVEDRFANGYQWYTATDNVWKIFSPSVE